MIDVISDHPIFRFDAPEFSAFYAPGCLCVTGREAADRFAATIGPPPHPVSGAWHHRLWQAADRALHDFKQLNSAPFAPECLTLYLNNECNLDCVYCFAEPAHIPSTRLGIDAVAAAADIVAAHCKAKNLPFTVVFHGGGEPTLHLDHVNRILATLDRIAQAHGVQLFRYIATNGILTGQRAAWLASQFDLVGLSCDGPPDIQNRQRPRVGGGTTSDALLHTVDMLHRQGCGFHVRATITAATLHRQAEIAEYICQHIAPEAIHFEPVYRSRKDSAATQLDAAAAPRFVAHFLAAREIAHSSGIPLSCSGTRLGTIHGPYCQVFRQVIQLVPPGIATACFKTTRADVVQAHDLIIGAFDSRTHHFELDHTHIQRLRDRLNRIPSTCADCFNRFHCVRQCPDACPLDHEAAWEANSFRCQVQKMLAYDTLRTLAGDLWDELCAVKNAGEAIDAHGTTTF